MDPRQRITDFVKALPAAHRVMIVAAVAALAMGGVLFASWVTTPSYTVLYSGLAPEDVAGTIEELESLGVPYELEGGGSTVLVPRDKLYETRAQLAGAGITGQTQVPGYELLDDQGLTVSDFRQRVDYQRALEGELSKTLTAMDGIDSATVRLVMPEEELFTERQDPVTASILLDTKRPLAENEVESVTFLVSSAVEGLTPEQITVADAAGTVLHAPGSVGGASVATNRNLRQTQEFETALATDITKLLSSAGGAPASVVVRATLDFDETQTQTDNYDPRRRVALTEQTTEEQFEGVGSAPGQTGTVGIDGAELPAGEGATSTYNKTENSRQFGVSRTTSTTTNAPGSVEKLSVAIVMDDGTLSGVEALPVGEVESLVGAAVGLDPRRGDTIAVSSMALPKPGEVAEEPAPAGPIALVPQIVGAFVLVLTCLALFLMTRRRRSPKVRDAEPTVLELSEGSYGDDLTDDTVNLSDGIVIPEPMPAVANGLDREVRELVSAQPEEIATLLRSWLADRRG